MKTILLVLFTAISVVTFSSDIKWSEIIKTGKRAPMPSVVGQDGKTIYLVRYESRSKMILSTYRTTNLGSTKSVPLVLKFKDKKLDYLGGYMINNQPVLATSFYNKKTKMLYYFAHKVSENLSVSKPILLGSVPLFGGYSNMRLVSGRGAAVTNNFFHVSENTENAFCLFNQGDKTNPSKKYKSILLDKNIDKIADIDITLPFLPENFVTLNQTLGNDGRFYILGYNIIEGKSKGILRSKTIYRDDLWLYAIDTETGELEQVKVETERDIEEIGFKVSSKGTIFVSALTSAEEGGVNGSMCIVYDNELVELNRTITPFESEFVKTTYSDKQLKKQAKKEKKANAKGKAVPKAKFYDYDMRHIIESENGSFTVFAEQWYVRVSTTTTSNGNGGTTTTTTYHYYYNDIIAINYDRDGRYQWKNVIEKRQYSTNDGGFFSSFFPVVDGNEIGLIFNTKEIENLDVEELNRGEKKAASRKTVCMNVTLISDGSVEKEELFSFDAAEKLSIAPRYSSQTSTGDVVIFAKSRKGSKIGVISL